jgi:hypothetical protein
MIMPEDPKAIAYFEGSAFWDAFDAQRDEYAGPDARLILMKQGAKYYVCVKGADGDGGDPLNDSHPCPGSPGCV